MASDIEGPLPRTQAGLRYILTAMCFGTQYILTAMCLGTRYPYAKPLKRVDAQTVAEALMEVFLNTGITAELSHDQDQVFMGKVTTTLCGLLNIKQLKTTPNKWYSGEVAWLP